MERQVDARNGRPLAAPRVLFAQGPGLPDQPLAPAASARRKQHVERCQRFCSARGGRLQVGPGKEGGGQLAAKPRLLGRALFEIPAEDADKESSEPKRRASQVKPRPRCPCRRARWSAQRQRRVQGLARGACPRSNDSPALQEAFLAPARSFWRAEPDLDVALPQKDDWAEAGVDLQHALGQDSAAVLRRQHRAELRGAEAAAAPQAQSLEDRRPRLGLVISHLATARETTLATAVGPRQYLNNAFASSVRTRRFFLKKGGRETSPTNALPSRAQPAFFFLLFSSPGTTTTKIPGGSGAVSEGVTSRGARAWASWMFGQAPPGSSVWKNRFLRAGNLWFHVGESLLGGRECVVPS